MAELGAPVLLLGEERESVRELERAGIDCIINCGAGAEKCAEEGREEEEEEGEEAEEVEARSLL